VQRADLTPAQQARFEQLWSQAKAADEPDQAIELLREALEIDERHAAAWFHLGKCYEAQQRSQAARAAFIRAKEEDICPLRIREPMYESIARVARDHAAPLIDLRPLFEAHCDQQIPGDEALLDHVHPTIEGHQWIALRILEEMQSMQIVAPRQGWDEDRKQKYRQHLESLDEVYFAQGKMRLEGLRMWTQGRSYKVRFSEE
jgi:tetratricopeptide (TPR) repeat protein